MFFVESRRALQNELFPSLPHRNPFPLHPRMNILWKTPGLSLNMKLDMSRNPVWELWRRENRLIKWFII